MLGQAARARATSMQTSTWRRRVQSLA